MFYDSRSPSRCFSIRLFRCSLVRAVIGSCDGVILIAALGVLSTDNTDDVSFVFASNKDALLFVFVKRLTAKEM